MRLDTISLYTYAKIYICLLKTYEELALPLLLQPQKLYPVSCIHFVKLQKNLLPESACIFPIILICFCYKGLLAYTHDFLFN